MTPLASLLIRRIRESGPIPLSDYMAECLMHPDHGYYATRDPFGQTGDFITAPEISQMFGEMIGLSLAQAWMDQGRPTPFILAEAGPGRGTLMADICRATMGIQGFHAAARLWLVETSPHLRKMQQRALRHARPKWVDRIEDLPEGPLFFVANEFLDALPIRQFTRRRQGWAECRVGLDGDGALSFGLTTPQPVADLAPRLADTQEGDIVETCPMAAPIAANLGARIATQGGAALLIDYGDTHSLGDTFQALKNHRPVDPLAEPGLADLTAHVDFEPLAAAAQASGAATSGPVPQGVWLERLGITARAQALAPNLSSAALQSHIAAHRRLTHPQEMGHLFKVLALHPQGQPLPGFED